MSTGLLEQQLNARAVRENGLYRDIGGGVTLQWKLDENLVVAEPRVP